MTYTATLDTNSTEDELTIRDPQGREMAVIQFWDSDEGSRSRAYADARLIVDALNGSRDLVSLLKDVREDWLTGFKQDVAEGDPAAVELLARMDAAIMKRSL